jgi:hypothetical protein
MGRRKKPAAEQAFEYIPPEKKSVKNRQLLVEQGNWEVFIDGLGFTKCKFRVTFVDDPKGCRGYGKTQVDATANLFNYESR